MYAIVVTSAGGPEQLEWHEVPDPELGPGELLIEVSAVGVNRADTLQRKGFYPPPPGASDILGLECSGTVIAIGQRSVAQEEPTIPGNLAVDAGGALPFARAAQFEIGQRVCALLSGGGYATKVAVSPSHVLPVPSSWTAVECAGLMEAACTVWSNLVMTARAAPGELVLIHGGAGGIGTMAIQVAHALGLRTAFTAGSDAKVARCLQLGADIGINYRTEDFVPVMRENGGADIILDVIGAQYLQRNIDALAEGGRLVVIGLQGGATAEVNLNDLLRKRASIAATALRSRAATGHGSKAEVVAEVGEYLLPMIEDGRIMAQVGAVMELPNAADAHALLESVSAPGGKLILTVPGAPQW
ncbi:NAD(P)H-quinone oxidoreductase [Nakamurella antarctica]|uniref:NAD(P)H-quinone oxidoreductase n=1 Tax=Nakamurella antarctica TaxID=1902245 RepID=A0A3G8ZJP5_9ACTN|nr:NAD(P)H-quinone oxidoreductase [Nakamurella antarctica]AZI57065.1 NAD(P)H-quinone oxidoreductase [Nakamurella antarctica]